MPTDPIPLGDGSANRVHPARRQPRRWPALAAAGLLTGLCRWAGAAPPTVLINPFHDPFEQATQGLAGCPVPSPPTYTQAEMQEVEHHRVERGNSCYLAGKCRLSNSFLYDRDIARALLPALRADPQLRDTSVWMLVQGRFVQLFGCVSRQEQIAHLEAVAHATPQVQAVLSDVLVGTHGKPPYPLASP
ncbi:Transport-associated protein (modular protein) [Thiomonas sp. X19]|uniref:BON domain-containing protein n=1 Tax=Thiomonas sp. X19 TaxID=1050370 RepID=UPI000B6980B5|nr:BON domain-containing protein [Thiomonas sp. X19]SCC94298.1 Transport-associated protein (modular protein) [Thiomonas sp. X19]